MVDTTNIHTTLHKYSLSTTTHVVSALLLFFVVDEIDDVAKKNQAAFLCLLPIFFPSLPQHLPPRTQRVCERPRKMAFRTRDLVDNQFSRTNRLLANRQQRLGDDGSNKSDGSIYTILLGLGVLGGIATWWYYPEFFNFRQGMSEEQRKLRKSVKKFRLKLKKPSEVLKLCKSTLNNNIISYNENKRDLNKLKMF